MDICYYPHTSSYCRGWGSFRTGTTTPLLGPVHIDLSLPGVLCDCPPRASLHCAPTAPALRRLHTAYAQPNSPACHRTVSHTLTFLRRRFYTLPTAATRALPLHHYTAAGARGAGRAPFAAWRKNPPTCRHTIPGIGYDAGWRRRGGVGIGARCEPTGSAWRHLGGSYRGATGATKFINAREGSRITVAFQLAL